MFRVLLRILKKNEKTLNHYERSIYLIPLNDENPDITKVKSVMDLDSDIHHPARMSILIFLLPRGKATFTTIQKALGLTSGNLSSHIKRLQTKGFVAVKKTFIDVKPTTEIYISEDGRSSTIEYASNLSSVLQNMLNDV